MEKFSGIFVYRYIRLFVAIVFLSFFLYCFMAKRKIPVTIPIRVIKNGKIIDIDLNTEDFQENQLQKVMNDLTENSFNKSEINSQKNHKKIVNEPIPIDIYTSEDIETENDIKHINDKKVSNSINIDTSIFKNKKQKKDKEELKVKRQQQRLAKKENDKNIKKENKQKIIKQGDNIRQKLENKLIKEKNHDETNKAQNNNKNKHIWPPLFEPTDAQILKHLDYSRYSDEDANFVKEYLPNLISRVRRLDLVCSKHADIMRERQVVPLLYDQTHTPNIVWCPNYKVASTTWMTNFFRLAHFNDDNPEILKMSPENQEKYKYHVRYGARHPVMFKLYPPPTDVNERVKVLKNSIKFTIVRHPFARFLSAFRDKMQKIRPLPLIHNFRELQKQIISTYRQEDINNTSPYPTFPEFIQHIIDSTEHLKTGREWNVKVKSWTPFWAQCNVCALDYNIVMKLETMNDDQKFLTIVSDLKEIKYHSEWRHQTGNSSSSDLGNSFYDQITQKQMKDLHQRYLLDFELFNYNIDDYLLIAKDANNKNN